MKSAWDEVEVAVGFGCSGLPTKLGLGEVEMRSTSDELGVGLDSQVGLSQYEANAI